MAEGRMSHHLNIHISEIFSWRNLLKSDLQGSLVVSMENN